jgi:hypothetical protein
MRHPQERLQRRPLCGDRGAWRELSGYDHPADPIGPEHGAAAPGPARRLARGPHRPRPASGPDVRGLPDGILLHVRDTYPLETAWAQRYFGDELRRVRAAAARDARLAAIRVAAGARAAERRGQHEQAAEQQVLAASYQALHDAYLDREAVFAVGMAGGADWDAATPHQRLWFRIFILGCCVSFTLVCGCRPRSLLS